MQGERRRGFGTKNVRQDNFEKPPTEAALLRFPVSFRYRRGKIALIPKDSTTLVQNILL